jgi:hypothetical protein
MSQLNTVKWETIYRSDLESTSILKVPGGWIYKHESIATGEGDWISGLSVSMVFVPEPTLSTRVK